ncbi:LuxR C-terminal-related transcriptional regulator [Novosphingobium sp. Chol11]|uniref:LuxR C-terminal-related transcriptional regulator n=1 Tax=Novosphingobium sp. Chol11 TaxID=1385763 RepID=UPI0025CE3870|nr:LuxR C-terminal-related transcriptional regulator [Novosphingobium sp. Chol11]
MEQLVEYKLDAHGENLLESIRRSPIASVISNPRLADNPIIAANEAFCALTGYPRDEIIGRNCKFLAGPGTEPWLTERISAGVRERRPVLVEIMNYKRDRSPFRNAVLVAPVFDTDGELEYFLGSQVELPVQSSGPSSARQARATALVKSLSARQREILELIARGQRNKQIAWQLGLSEKTVDMHRTLLFQKLDTHNVADAIRIAVEAGL